jgi:hypothetical protein
MMVPLILGRSERSKPLLVLQEWHAMRKVLQEWHAVRKVLQEWNAMRKVLQE